MNNNPALLDRVAIALSGLCMLHCLALPLLLLATPMLGQFSAGHFHLQVLVFVLPVSLVALYAGYQRHRHGGVAAWGAAGLLLLIIGATWVHNEMGLVAERLVTISGSLILAVAHYANSRPGRRRVSCATPG